ncbi:hypothetical protein RF11_05794 [Thelohanellus kitauei]|uniref:Uncharacterized protein n=1 Tax=Thelohanellus kitauei TaxID=669202 RepID=A0A0C2IW49_THEKT|nr:hypothetical protein RF11_05794 [Thelohanellus kitauei]
MVISEGRVYWKYNTNKDSQNLCLSLLSLLLFCCTASGSNVICIWTLALPCCLGAYPEILPNLIEIKGWTIVKRPHRMKNTSTRESHIKDHNLNLCQIKN